MRSSRPYLVRALYEWIIDNQLTPYILVNAEIAGTAVPQEHVEDGKIILNISPNAIHDLYISNQIIEFDASFSNKPQTIRAPIKAILAVYARENGRGMVFDPEEEIDDDGDEGATSANLHPLQQRPSKSRKPKLTVIK